jgi:penicillin-binding protein 2
MMRDPFASVGRTRNPDQGSQLEWEESALDSRSSVEGFWDEHRQSPKFVWLLSLIVLLCAVLVIKLFSLQVVSGQYYRKLSEGNRLRNQVILAPRGFIKDTRGQLLAQNKASYSLVATPADLPKEGLRDQVERLAQLIHFEAQEIMTELSNYKGNAFEPVVLKQNISAEEKILFETKASEFAGFSVRTIPIRDYIEPEIFSHVLGYAGIVSESELAKSQTTDNPYSPIDFIGKSGIELSYEQDLRGLNGVNQIEVDASGVPVQTIGTIDPEAGNILELNIDKELQEQLYRNFTQNASTIKGAAVALDPRTGAVLALVSLPGYNNNLFAEGISHADYERLLNDKSLPLFNRAIAGTYAPGSTVKPMVSIAALEQGVVTENTVIVDRGVLTIPNQFNPSILYNFYGWKRGGLGPMTVRSAIAQSSDIYYYTVSGGHPNSQIKGLGAEKLAEYYRKFNLGKPTGIDLQGEKSGVVADPEWKANFFKDDPILREWYLGDTYHIGIGQGDMLATPLQVALWTATIANDGVGMKPQLLKRVVREDGTIVREMKPEVVVQKFASDKNIAIVQEGMRETVLSGSGHSLADLPISSAGKTGTSQFDGSDPTRTHAWFTMYAPYEDPQIVITLLVEAGGEGHTAANSIVKPTLEWWAKNRMGK